MKKLLTILSLFLFTSPFNAQIDTNLLNKHLRQNTIDMIDLYAAREMSPKQIQIIKSYKFPIGSSKSTYPTDKSLKILMNEFEDSTQLLFYFFAKDTLHSWLISKRSIYHDFVGCDTLYLKMLEQDFVASLPSEIGVFKGDQPVKIKLPKNRFREAQSKLNSILFPPGIHSGLNDSKYLIIVPTLNISTIPIYLLNPFSSNELIIDKWTYTFAHCLQNLFEKTESKNLGTLNTLEEILKESINFYGSSKFECENFRAIEEVEREIKLFDETSTRAKTIMFKEYENNLVYLNEQAKSTTVAGDVKTNLMSFEKNSTNTKVSILYFSSHGVSGDKKVEDNYLIFSDCSILNEKDIQKMYLKNIPLVILSACNSGVGKSLRGGTMSVGRGFMKAGVDNIVFSLWSVDAKATTELMSNFGKELYDVEQFGELKFSDASSIFFPAQQLRNAMLKFRQIDSNPKHWAAFVSMGIPITNF